MLDAIVPYWRLIRLVGALAAVVFVVFFVHHKFEVWRSDLYNTAYQAGVTDNNLKWQTASAKAAQQQVQIEQANEERSRQAISDWLAQMQQIAPKLHNIETQRTVYVTSTAGAAACLDADGVRLIRSQRSALGLDAGVGQPGPQDLRPAP